MRREPQAKLCMDPGMLSPRKAGGGERCDTPPPPEGDGWTPMAAEGRARTSGSKCPEGSSEALPDSSGQEPAEQAASGLGSLLEDLRGWRAPVIAAPVDPAQSWQLVYMAFKVPSSSLVFIYLGT